MATKLKKSLRSSIDDVLGDLLGDDDDIPVNSGKPTSFGSTDGKAREIAPQASRKGLLDDDFFNKMAVEEGADAEEPDISDVDPEAILETLKDMDEMEADILGIKKTSTKSPQKTVKSVGTAEPLDKAAKTKTTTNIERGDSAGEVSKNLGSVLSLSLSKPLKQRFSLEDIDDPLAGLLSDDEETPVKKTHSSLTKTTPEISGTPSEKVHGHGIAPEQKQEELMFEDDGDDLMEAVGFGEASKAEVKSGRRSDEKESHPARARQDELLGLGTAKKLLERPSTGKPKEFKLDKKYQKQTDKEDVLGDDFTFGAYQPTMASTPEGRKSRRQSVRFSSENLSDLKTEERSKPFSSASNSPIRNKSGADWLGLKDEDSDLLPSSPLKEPSKSSARGTTLDMPSFPSEAKDPPSPPTTLQSPLTTTQVTEEVIQKKEPAEDDGDSWLNNVLSQKKSQAWEKMRKRSGALDVQTHGDHLTSQRVISTQEQHRSAATSHKPARLEQLQSFVPWERSQEQSAPTFSSDSRKGTPFGDTISRASATFGQGHQETTKVPVNPQAVILEPLLSSPNNADYETKMVGVQAQLRETLGTYQAELLSAQTRFTELEVQVRRLELEKNQQKLLLESLQRRHQEDLELIENAHRTRVKVVEDSYSQREDRLRQENQELVAQYLSRCQSAEEAKSEMLAQHQRRLTELEQEKAKEIDRLRELQRMSILEMRKDHEEQLQRLKQLKSQEIDAVTSATSYTRSLNGVIDQMEKFSSNLNDLASKVEATHHTTHQGLEMGARQRDEQLRVLQDRLNRQQRDMEDERGRLQEVISKMEARLNEQTRLLEQERWRVTTEQAKVESLQRSLEEQRRVMTQQLTMEREELERAKNSLLEEQKAVMQKCAEERRKVAAEWSELHVQQRLSKERSEREVDRALQIDSQREGAIMSLAKEQADLKIKSSELRSREEQLVRDRELLEQEKQELRLEKERVNAAALHVKQKADEINSMSKVSSHKYEEGEKALVEAKKVESEHQARLQSLQQQMEWLRQQEEHLHQERLSLSQQRRQLEQLRMELPSNPWAFQKMPQLPLLGTPDKIISNVHYLPLPVTVPPKANPGNTIASQRLPRPDPADLYAKLVLHKITAERDHDFLEEEQFFLETLKRTSYKTSFQSA